MYKLTEGISFTIMQEIFKFENNRRYNLKSQNFLKILFRNYVYKGFESISYLGRKVWELVQIVWKKLTHWLASKKKLRNGTQKIAHADYVKPTFNTIVLQIRHGLLLLIFLWGTSKIFVFAYISFIAFRF